VSTVSCASDSSTISSGRRARQPTGLGPRDREFFPDTMRAIADVTPHAWGYQAFADIQRRNGTLADIAPQLAVLGAMAAGVLVLGAWSLRRPLARPT